MGGTGLRDRDIDRAWTTPRHAAYGIYDRSLAGDLRQPIRSGLNLAALPVRAPVETLESAHGVLRFARRAQNVGRVIQTGRLNP